MKIGMVGAGKLGLPVAVAIAQHHEVLAYDVNPENMRKQLPYPHREVGWQSADFDEMLKNAKLEFGSMAQIGAECDLIFVAVQTPHKPRFEGATPLPLDRADFDYGYLVGAIDTLKQFVKPTTIVVVISTCLPGTIRKHVVPLLEGRCKLVYNPFFIAMGTVVQDFYNPEFVLLGGDNEAAVDNVIKFYMDLRQRVHGSYAQALKVSQMSIESAELTKVAYNTFIGMKIAYANTLMEIAHKIPGCNVDSVMNAIKSANDRLISKKYLTPGMGDGGGCHPRDNIAMSWLAKRLNLSHDFFEDIMLAREDQARWLSKLMIDLHIDVKSKNGGELRLVILGKSFKPETNITTGSPSFLVRSFLAERGWDVHMHDPHVDGVDRRIPPGPAIYLVGTKHDMFKSYKFEKGSIVIDPHRYMPDQEGVEVIRLGARA